MILCRLMTLHDNAGGIEQYVLVCMGKGGKGYMYIMFVLYHTYMYCTWGLGSPEKV